VNLQDGVLEPHHDLRPFTHIGRENAQNMVKWQIRAKEVLETMINQLIDVKIKLLAMCQDTSILHLCRINV
jgi:hypothetical protein